MNAIVDYTLVKCNNVLNSTFADKVSGSVAREHLTNALDTMNYLTKKKQAKPKSTYVKQVVEEELPHKKEESHVEQVSDDEMNSILESFSKRKGGKK